MIETVILDWSGVVSDDLEAVWLTSNDILEERSGRAISFMDFRKNFELPFMNFYKKLGIEITPEDERERWERIFPKYMHKLKIIPKAGEAIAELKKMKKKLLVFSAHNDNLLRQEARDYGIADSIDGIHAGVNDKREEILLLVKKHRLNPKKTVFAGDTGHDIETAKCAGIKSVAVLSGYSSRETLEASKPDFFVNNLGELPALLRQLDGEKK